MATTVISGKLFKDAEIKTSAKGTDYVTMVVSEQEYDSQNRKNVNVYYNVTVFGERYKNMATKLLRKGAIVAASGSLNPRPYAGKNGPAVSRDILAQNIEFKGFAQENNNQRSDDEPDDTL